jgi:hypothetical protein
MRAGNLLINFNYVVIFSLEIASTFVSLLLGWRILPDMLVVEGQQSGT